MWEAGSTEESGQRKQRSPEKPIPEHPQHCPCGERKAAGLEDLLSRGLQTLAITHSRRTDGFAAAAAQAAVQVLEQCRVVRADLCTLERSHKDNAAAREIPMTLERAPWPVRRALGHFGAYREGVGQIVGRLRDTFDPGQCLNVALEGVDNG
jgi:hypothetical protein